MNRVEDKYELSFHQYNILINRLDTIMIKDSYTVDKIGYKISSVYFDNYLDRYLQDTIDGNPIRKKYRIRIYNDSFDMIKAEIKYKQYNRIKKISRKITLQQMKEYMEGKVISMEEYDMNNPMLLYNLAITNEILRPKVIVTYERIAFINDSGNVRITLDSNVRGSNMIERFGDPNLIYNLSSEVFAVLEVKYDEFLPDYITQVLELNRMQQISYSKYRICREICV